MQENKLVDVGFEIHALMVMRSAVVRDITV
jgi:hypothetical protein